MMILEALHPHSSNPNRISIRRRVLFGLGMTGLLGTAGVTLSNSTANHTSKTFLETVASVPSNIRMANDAPCTGETIHIVDYNDDLWGIGSSINGAEAEQKFEIVSQIEQMNQDQDLYPLQMGSKIKVPEKC